MKMTLEPASGLPGATVEIIPQNQNLENFQRFMNLKAKFGNEIIPVALFGTNVLRVIVPIQKEKLTK